MTKNYKIREHFDAEVFERLMEVLLKRKKRINKDKQKNCNTTTDKVKYSDTDKEETVKERKSNERIKN